LRVGLCDRCGSETQSSKLEDNYAQEGAE